MDLEALSKKVKHLDGRLRAQSQNPHPSKNEECGTLKG